MWLKEQSADNTTFFNGSFIKCKHNPCHAQWNHPVFITHGRIISY